MVDKPDSSTILPTSEMKQFILPDSWDFVCQNCKAEKTVSDEWDAVHWILERHTAHIWHRCGDGLITRTLQRPRFLPTSGTP